MGAADKGIAVDGGDGLEFVAGLETTGPRAGFIASARRRQRVPVIG